MKHFILLFCLFFLCTCAIADVVQKHFDFKTAPPQKASQAATVLADTASVMPIVVSVSSVKNNSNIFTRSAFWLKLVDTQKILREKMANQIELMQSGNDATISLFLLICFVYGILHALGPGHGKTIVAGYFLARRGRFREGIVLGASITLIHTFSAVILLFVLYNLAQATVFPTFELSRAGIEKASYLLIIITGILLVAISIKGFLSTRKKEEKANLNASWKELLWIAFITGIVPCPAVALIVFFCLLNGLPGMALAGALVIGIGMAVTNISFGFAAILFRRGLDTGFFRLGYFANFANYGISLIGGLFVGAMGILLYWGTL